MAVTLDRHSSGGSMELRDYVALFSRRKWIIIMAVVLVTGTALGVSFLQSPVYQANSRLFLEPTSALFESSGSQQLSPARIQTEIQVIQSAPVRDVVREKLGSAPPVSAIQLGNTEVIEVRVQGTTPRRAAEFTDAYVQAYIDYRRTQAIHDLRRKGEEIQKILDGLKATVAEIDRNAPPDPEPGTAFSGSRSTPERDAAISQQAFFKQKLDQLNIDSGLRNGSAQVVAPAEVPTTPVSPRPVRNGVLGFGLGLVLGIAVALVIEHLDDSIKTKEDLERVTRGTAVIGMIPVVPSWKNRAETRVISKIAPNSPAAEAYRSLRTSINFIGVDRAMRVIQVTSANASEGKTTTIANLAVALAGAGERVVIVNCDLRRPRVHDFFGLPDSIGFTDVFLGEMPMSGALQSVPGEPKLRLLASGKLPPNPSELLSSPRTEQILTQLKTAGFLVLIDCPPILPVTDAAVLSSRVDATVVVATAGSTTGKDLARALELLQQVGAPIIGTVLNGVSADSGYGYQYGYYGGSSSKHPSNGRKAGNVKGTLNGSGHSNGSGGSKVKETQKSAPPEGTASGLSGPVA